MAIRLNFYVVIRNSQVDDQVEVRPSILDVLEPY